MLKRPGRVGARWWWASELKVSTIPQLAGNATGWRGLVRGTETVIGENVGRWPRRGLPAPWGMSAPVVMQRSFFTSCKSEPVCRFGGAASVGPEDRRLGPDWLAV